MRLLLTALVASACAAGVAHAATTAPAEFSREYIREMGELEKLRTSMATNTKKDQGFDFSQFAYYCERVQSALQADIGLMGAVRLEDQFKELPSQLVQFYRIKLDIHRQMGEVAAAMMVPQPGVDYASMVKRMPKLRADNDEIDESIGKNASPLVIANMLDLNGDAAGHVSHLRITGAERVALIKEIKSTFGAKLELKDVSWFVFSGQVLLDALNGHRGSDE